MGISHQTGIQIPTALPAFKSRRLFPGSIPSRLHVLIAGGGGYAVLRAPVAVSPASESGTAVVGDGCPTFSWTALDWAAGYRVAVFAAPEAETKSYEQMDATADPVLSQEIRGRALSWTPSTDRKLSRGLVYVWYVQAFDRAGRGVWSAGKLFRVEEAAGPAGILDRLAKKLRESGVSDAVILDVFNNAKAESRGFLLQGEGQAVRKADMLPNINRGLEGETNTFYGMKAGYGITTGTRNTFIGAKAGYLNFAGSSNIYIGSDAGYNSNNSYFNIFIGNTTGFNNTTGHDNIFLGTGSAWSNISGSFNTFIGKVSGYYKKTGDFNTFLGYSSGFNNTSGSGNIFIGHKAGSKEAGSGKLYIDNSDTSTPLIYGEFDKDILTVNGKLGIGLGIKSPVEPMELQTAGANATFVLRRTDGATSFMKSAKLHAGVGTETNHPMRIIVNSNWRMELRSDNSLTMANGASCSAGGAWQDASSRTLKENIRALDSDDALTALAGLEPVRFNYKSDKNEECLGFIAEDVPGLVATKDRATLSPMDIIAVLTKVVQEQQKTMKELKARIAELENRSMSRD